MLPDWRSDRVDPWDAYAFKNVVSIIKNFGPKNVFQKDLALKNWGKKTKLGQKTCDSKTIWIKRSLVQKIFGSKGVQSKRNVGQQKLRPPKIWSNKFGQKRISNSWDIANMYECYVFYHLW